MGAHAEHLPEQGLRQNLRRGSCGDDAPALEHGGNTGAGIPINLPPLSVVATGQLNLATSQLMLKGVVISTHIDLFGMVIPIDIPLDTITVQL